MLEPYFFRYPADLPALEEGQQWQVIGYSRVGQYTLVKWRLDFGFDGPNGDNLESESLYRDKELLGSERLEGRLPLYEAPVPIAEGPSTIPEFQASVWDQLDAKTGAFGVSPADSMALRDPLNYVCFQPFKSYQ